MQAFCKPAFGQMRTHFRVECRKRFWFNGLRFQKAEPRRIHQCTAISNPELRMARRVPAALRFAGKLSHGKRKFRQQRIEQ